MKLVLASNNAKKLAELQTLFAGLAIELVSQASLGITEAEEPHHSFVENALAKARHAAQASGLPAIADDSGLCVAALGGAPGVQSAGYAGLVAAPGGREAQRRAQDAANNALLLESMRGIADRRARFVSTLIALRHADDPEPLVASGRWEATLLSVPRGSGGFGYDSLVWIESLGASVAELGAEQKNRVSHRALAAAQMRELMRKAWSLG
ncbi:MAG: RdgB/HAM1 family non-canonical purine NTP pyrophosphatase [Burkholderiaceae bacterium]|nr:RdgB/HAM1 family non-canonical purine NTP pyrophosphatase [Burkholderiaceae bacterium]